MNTSIEKVTKHLVFPAELAKQIEQKASKVGFTFAEYLRHIAVNDVEEDIPYVDEETEKAIGESYEDYRNGRYYTIKSSKDLELILRDSKRKKK